MAKRIKKPAVDLEQRQEWLKRYEAGESPPHIAKSDGFDVRTVRKHIELARQEREVKEARFMVLRNALESHYDDLCGYAEKLTAQVSGQKAVESPRDEYMQSALRQHLPRSPMWGYIKQREGLQQQINQLIHEAGTKLEKLVGSDLRLSSGLDSSERGVVLGIVVALKFQIEQWAKGNRGLNVEDDLIEEIAEEGFVNLRYGFAHMGNVKKGHVKLIQKVLWDSESRVKEWEEGRKLEKSFTELKRVEKNLKDELAVITLRKIVPGRCRYCPL